MAPEMNKFDPSLLDSSPLFEGIQREKIVEIVNMYHFGFNESEDEPSLQTLFQKIQEKLRKSVIRNLDEIPFYKYNDPSIFYQIINEFYHGEIYVSQMDMNQDALINFMLANIKGEVAYIEYSLPSDFLHFSSQSYKNFLVRIGNKIKPITISV